MNSERKIPPICKVCQVLDDGATNHEYCKTFLQQESIREEKERKKEAKRKKKAMEAILDEHYKDDEPESKRANLTLPRVHHIGTSIKSSNVESVNISPMILKITKNMKLKVM